MKKITISILTIMLVSISVFAQTKATTEDGEKVILNEDGTWIIDTIKIEKPTIIVSKEDCNYSKNEVDEFSGKRKVVLKEEKFIGYTSDKLKKYYKKKDYVNCQAYCASINETKVIYFYWKLLTKSAYKYFGSIEKGTKLVLKFNDRETLELKFSKYDNGDTNYDYDYTTYSSYILIDEETIKILKENEIEKVRMYWSKGYEDYPVESSQLFMKQLPCIE